MRGCCPPGAMTKPSVAWLHSFIPTDLCLAQKVDDTQLMSKHSISVVLLLFNRLLTKSYTSWVLRKELFFTLWAFVSIYDYSSRHLTNTSFCCAPSGRRGTIVIPYQEKEADPCTNTALSLTDGTGTSLSRRTQHSTSKASFQPPLLHLHKLDTVGSSLALWEQRLCSSWPLQKSLVCLVLH